MMKLFYTIMVGCGVLLLTSNSYAQEQRIIGSAGSYSETSNYSVSYTIGELVIPTANSTSNNVTQGFHQPDIFVVNIEEYVSNVDISVYPNPARDNVNITSSEKTEMTLYDIQGKKIETMSLSAMTSTIDVSHLSRGTYTLVFTTSGKIAKRMKIIIL